MTEQSSKIVPPGRAISLRAMKSQKGFLSRPGDHTADNQRSSSAATNLSASANSFIRRFANLSPTAIDYLTSLGMAQEILVHDDCPRYSRPNQQTPVRSQLLPWDYFGFARKS